MGNFLCSASGERLASASRDGDVEEARMLLEQNPGLATYSTFAASNSPLHFAASRGHHEIVSLLLENGTGVNSRNFCGQTALTLACRRGHWQVVLALLIFRSNVTKSEYLSGKTALHFAAAGGHIRCIRLLVTDFVPSTPYGTPVTSISPNEENNRTTTSSPESTTGTKFGHYALLRFINKVADGGVTALHLAARKGNSDCLQLLLDLHANVSATTYHYGSSNKMIVDVVGGGSTPLHFAASGGNMKCCEILLARGSSRLTLNCNGWLPVDVARICGYRYLEPLLSPNCDLKIPTLSPSCFLSLPLTSIINIAREYGLQSAIASCDDTDLCAICLENACSVAAEGCKHELCVKCALHLCSANNITSVEPPGSVPCPLCRYGIVSFVKLQRTPQEAKLIQFQGLCTQPYCLNSLAMTCRSEVCKNCMATVSASEVI